ncbi:PAS domain S-box protein [Roseomonas sp. F4]
MTTLQPGTRQAEILDLLDTLRATQQRLVELTDGQVDALIDPLGQRHLLPRAQEDILRAAGTFQNIFCNAAVGIVSTDADHHLREVNPAFCAMLGFGAEELLGRRMTELDDPNHPSNCGELIREILRGLRQGFVAEKRFLTRDGASLWTRVSVSALRDHEGTLEGLVAIVEDISVRKATEAANERLAARLAATVASISDAFFTLDQAGRLTHVNDRAAALFDRPAQALLGHAIAALPGFDPAERFGETLRAATETRRMRGCEAPLGAAGQWLEMRAYPSAEGLTVVLHDITERRRREDWQRLLETCIARLNHIVLITEGAPLSDPGPRIVFTNEAFQRRTGYTPGEVLGLTPRLLQGPKTQRAELDRIRAALQASRPVQAELLNYSKTGEEFWIEMEIVPVMDVAGTVTHWVSVEREITDRRRYQTQLEQQAALLEQVQDAILVQGIDQRIHYWNQGAQRLYGWRVDEALGRPAASLVGGEPDLLATAMQAVLRDGRWTGQLRQHRREGSALVVEARWTLVRHEDGTPRAILAVQTDITERLELEQRLRQAQRLEAIGQLTGGVAHDFNNLLTVILGNSEMLADGLAQGSELRQMAEMSIAAAERAAALTGRLLAFSRRQALDPKPVDVNALLTGLGQMLRRTIGAQVAMEIRTAPDLSLAMIDAPQLETSVLNLCINARDAMPDGGRLLIETGMVRLDAAYARIEGEVTPGDYIMLQVSDTGTGMTPDVVAHAFEPFFTTKEVGQGSGLGLSMVFGFMKQSGGHVAIHSEPGKGTRVRMFLPPAPGELPAESAAPIEAELRGGEERILVVEDDAAVRIHVAGLLRDLGYQVTDVPDAAEALAALHQDAGFALLFTDIVMPGGMNGPELAALAQELRPGLRVLLTSGYNDPPLARPDIQGATLPLLNKPYRRQVLAEKLRSVLDGLG